MTTTDPTITIAGLRARINSLLSAVQHSNRTTAERVTMFVEASSNADRLTAERDALAAQLAKVRAELAAAPKVCAIHSYALEGPCMTCGAPWPGAEKALRQERIEGMEKMRRISRAVGCPNSVEEVVEAVAAIKADLASERAHLAACRTRIAGLEQSADERSAEVARLTARVAELEARPVLTVEAAVAAAKSAGWSSSACRDAETVVGAILAALGPVTLPPAQDDPMRHHESRDYALQSPANGYWPADVGAVNGTEALAMGAMLRSVGPIQINDVALLAMARAAIACVDKLGAPPTSPPAARPVFAGVSEDELARTFWCATGRGYKPEQWETLAPSTQAEWIKGTAAVLARLEVSLVAPVDPEEVARDYANNAATGYAPGIDHPPYWFEYTDEQRTKRTAAMRATLIARGIPVTPEVGK